MKRSESYVMGIDIGTQGVKGALFDKKGSCVAQWTEPSFLQYPEKGAITEDPEYQYQSVLRVIRMCVEKGDAAEGYEVSAHIVALAIDGQMAGIIGIGDDGTAATPYDSWLDCRCAPYLELMKKEANDQILKKAGTAPSINHGPKILWWKEEHPEVFAKISSFVQPAGYVAMRLCGLSSVQSFIDKTYLHFSGFSDTEKGIWDHQLCAFFGVPEEKLPRIVDSTALVGSVSAEAARLCLLKEGTPVAAGCGDTVASFLASGAVEEGISVDVAGTASVFACTQNKFAPDVKSGILGCCASVVPDLWYSYAYINGGGMNPEWLLKLTGNQQGGANRFQEIEQAVAQIPDSMTLPLFIPHMAGRVMPGKPELRGAFAGLTWEHEKAHVFRAIWESVALEYGIYKEAAMALQPDLHVREVRVTGGGEKSVAWNTIKSGVLQAPVVRISQNQGAPMGAAMVAAVASGLYSNFSDIAHEWVSKGETIFCDATRYSYFSKRLTAYKRLLELMEDFTDEFPFKDME